MIFELARSEQNYTYQRPAEYTTSVLAGCIAADWRGPVFIQGDHYQFNAKKYAADPEATTEEIRRARRAGGRRRLPQHRHRLVDARRPLAADRGRAAARELPPRRRADGAHPDARDRGVTISIGGEIGEVGKENSTEAELRAYLDGYRRELDRLAPGALGISKVSVQTGTSHGGVPLPDGGVAEVKLDFEVLRELGDVARELRPGGRGPARRVDASRRAVPPLPGGRDGRDPSRDGLPEPALRPSRLPGRRSTASRRVVLRQHADERKAGQTDEQFLYTTRKKALGPLKRQLWELPDEGRDPRDPARKIAYLFAELRVVDTPPWWSGTPAGASSTVRSPTYSAGSSRQAETAVDRARRGAYPRAQVKRRSEGSIADHDTRPSVPSVPVSTPWRGHRLPVRWEEENSWRDQVNRLQTSPHATTHIFVR